MLKVPAHACVCLFFVFFTDRGFRLYSNTVVQEYGAVASQAVRSARGLWDRPDSVEAPTRKASKTKQDKTTRRKKTKTNNLEPFDRWMKI